MYNAMHTTGLYLRAWGMFAVIIGAILYFLDFMEGQDFEMMISFYEFVTGGVLGYWTMTFILEFLKSKAEEDKEVE